MSVPVENDQTYSALSLRRRSVWEAVDSGILLWRHSFVYFIPFFALPVWIIACSLRLLPDGFTWLSYLVLWWLKPLFDRLALHVVSLRFFGSPAPSGFRELGKGLLKNLGKGLAGDLLWRRFSPGRAARMPVRILERLGLKQYRQRKNALAVGGLNFCSFISALGLAMEGMLLLGEFAFVVMIAQILSPSALSYMRNNMETMEIFIFAAFCLNYILVESLYVCMGFGIYINSRVEVEGWDLQILFRKFAGQDAAAKGRPGTMAVLCICFFLALPHAAGADSGEYAEQSTGETAELVQFFPSDFPSAGTQSLEALEQILASPDFGSEKEGWGIRFRERVSDAPEIPNEELLSWLEKIKRMFGLMLRALVVLAIAGFTFFVLWWLVRIRRKGTAQRRRSSGRSYANPLVSPESPDTLFSRAEDLFGRGSLREAWAACLAGCLGSYTKYHFISFPADATEYGCLDLVNRTLPAEAGDFVVLVRDWIIFAYGGRNPGEGAFEKALAYGRSIGRYNEP